MPKARRAVLDGIELDTRRYPHAGLWLDKFLKEQTAQGGENTYTAHFEKATTIPIAPTYKHFFERWEATLKDAGARMVKADTLGRLVVGLGADGVLENAITLHRTYGVPVIPGSALKGLAAAYARNRLEDEAWHVKTDKRGKIIYMGEAYKTLFGDTTSAGYVTFFDALYVPGSATGDKPLALDVVTVHHPDYYQGKDSPPADWDSPNPVPFVSVRGGVRFLLALAGPDKWVDAAFQILALALAEEGIGAKTNSGYGRIALEMNSRQESHIFPPQETYHLAKLRLLKQETPPPGRHRGEVVDVLGSYAFINPAKGGAKVFVHESQIQSGATSLRKGQIVEYSLGPYRGKTQAQKVDVLLEP